jgi:cytochrome c biogenesis protein CcmG/thiol:disulfide interchange protein DsbE
MDIISQKLEGQDDTGSRSLGKVLIYAIVLAILALLGWGLVRANANPRTEGTAPDFTLSTFNGEHITLSDLRGQVVVINFWASWCLPCKEEAPYLEATWRKYKNRRVVFIGVDYLDTETKALEYIEEFDITYPNGPDIETRISYDYRIQGVPETFFVAKDGTLRGVKIGPLMPPELEDRITELLAEAYP